MKRAITLGLALATFGISHADLIYSTGTPNWYMDWVNPTGSYSASTFGQVNAFNPGTSSNLTMRGMSQNFWAVRRIGTDSTFQALKFTSSATSALGFSASANGTVVEQYNNSTFSLFVTYTLVNVASLTTVGSTNPNDAKAYLKMDWKLTNKGATTTSYAVANYAELRPSSQSTNYSTTNTVTYANNTFTSAATSGDPNASKMYMWAPSVSHYSSAIYTTLRPQVGGTAGSGSLGVLNDTVAGASTENGVAMEQDVTSLGAGSSAYGTVVIGYNVVPEPSTFAAMGLGAIALLRRRRKA